MPRKKTNKVDEKLNLVKKADENKLALIKKIKANTKYKKKIKTLSEAKSDYTPDDYFDVGNIMLRLLISGDWRKGMPSNTTILLLGDPDTGKSLFARILAFDANSKGYLPTILESEGATMYDTLINAGFTEDKLMLYDDIEHTKEAGAILQEGIELADRNDKQIFIIDSMANLPSSEAYEKRKKGDASPEMGTKAKEIHALFRPLTKTAFLKNKPLVLVNRETVDMNAGKYTPEENKKVSTGGTAMDYNASISLRFLKKYLKKKVKYRDSEGTLKSRTEVYGAEYTVIAKKSRFVWSNLYIKFIILNDGSLQKYSGLWTELTKENCPFFKFEGTKQGNSKFRDLFILKDGKYELYKSIKEESDITSEDWDHLLENGFGDYLNKQFSLPKTDYSEFFK